MLNLDLLTKMIEWAEASERMLAGQPLDTETLDRFRGWGVWNQDEWAQVVTCGTAYCQAGQAANQTGWRMILPDVLGANASFCVKDTETRPIKDVAAEVLGLTPDEAAPYFDPGNDIEALKNMVDGFCQARGMAPVYSGVLV